MKPHDPKRRALLALAGAAACCPATLWASAHPVRSLWLIRSETREEIKADYIRHGMTNADAYAKICVLLRDVKEQQAVVMDSKLLDSLFLIQSWLSRNDYRQPLVINSGYRTKKTNQSTEGASKNSLHTTGQAADIWVPGLSANALRQLATMFEVGGIGYYPKKNFIHVDSGSFRTWRGA